MEEIKNGIYLNESSGGWSTALKKGQMLASFGHVYILMVFFSQFLCNALRFPLLCMPSLTSFTKKVPDFV